MQGKETLLSQAVADICVQAGLLESRRLELFLDWLQTHHHADPPFTAEGLSVGLQDWFQSLGVRGTLWEYHLILDEIAWWRGLKEERIFRFLNDGEDWQNL
jgi:hypothetical protein